MESFQYSTDASMGDDQDTLPPYWWACWNWVFGEQPYKKDLQNYKIFLLNVEHGTKTFFFVEVQFPLSLSLLTFSFIMNNTGSRISQCLPLGNILEHPVHAVATRRQHRLTKNWEGYRLCCMIDYRFKMNIRQAKLKLN